MNTDNIVHVRHYGAKLSGMYFARKVYSELTGALSRSKPLELNMSGVTEITPGFARDCFGQLVADAKQRGQGVKFSYTEKGVSDQLLKGIKESL